MKNPDLIRIETRLEHDDLKRIEAVAAHEGKSSQLLLSELIMPELSRRHKRYLKMENPKRRRRA